jgi:hypothetical protein
MYTGHSRYKHSEPEESSACRGGDAPAGVIVDTADGFHDVADGDVTIGIGGGFHDDTDGDAGVRISNTSVLTAPNTATSTRAPSCASALRRYPSMLKPHFCMSTTTTARKAQQ